MQQIFLLVLLYITIPSFSLISKNRYVVISKQANLYHHSIDNKVINTLDIGSSFIGIDESNNRIKLIYQNKIFWINKKDLQLVDFTVKKFVSETRIFTELPVSDEQNFWFIYKSGLYKMKISDPQVFNATLQASLPYFSDITSSDDHTMFLLIGEIINNVENSLNIALYNTVNRTFMPLTIFESSLITLNNSIFSQNNKYVVLSFSIGDNNIVHVYDTTTLELVLVKTGILDISVMKNSLFIYDKKHIYSYNLDDNIITQPISIFTFKNKEYNNVQTAIINNQNLFQINQQVYLFTNNSLEKNDYKSLERSTDGNIEYINSNNIIRITYKGQQLRFLSGAKPRWMFMSILDNNRIIYKQQKDALQIINIYNLDTLKSYPYYWIEQPFYIYQSGVAIETIVENKEVFLFMEKPSEWVKEFRLHQLLK